MYFSSVYNFKTLGGFLENLQTSGVWSSLRVANRVLHPQQLIVIS
jgi:hypothetical protein